jgi:hypothetical protein
MAVATIKRVTIVDDSMYHGKGVVIRWVGIVTRKFARESRAFAPRRSGRLKAGILPGTPRNPFRKVVKGTVSSSAPYTLYVLRGTHGPIMSNKLWAVGGPDSPAAYRVIIRRTGRGGKPHPVRVPVKGMQMAVGRNLRPPVTPMFTVNGQKANNFMAKAWATTAAAHSGLGPFPIPLRAK